MDVKSRGKSKDLKKFFGGAFAFCARLTRRTRSGDTSRGREWLLLL
nr:MAG TPA: hypothetical protein [Caudoviricetes sp.]